MIKEFLGFIKFRGARSSHARKFINSKYAIKRVVRIPVVCLFVSVLVVACAQRPMENSFGRYLDKVYDPRSIHMLAAIVDRKATTTYAELSVRIPEDHEIGQIEIPEKYAVYSLKRWTNPSNQKTFFQYMKPHKITSHEFRNLISLNRRKSALVFVHGYNNTLKEAALRLGQIMFDTQYTGQPIIFRWASVASLWGYKKDRASLDIARKPFIQLLNKLQSTPSLEEIHILAHSRGNLLVLDALASAKPFTKKPISELIMAHPDVDQDLYKQLVKEAKNFTKGMTLYASSEDFPLWFSGIAGGNISAGAVGTGGPVSINGIDSIDISALAAKDTGLRHATFAENRSVVDDIGRLITHGVRPPNHRSPQIQSVPYGVRKPKFWKFVK